MAAEDTGRGLGGLWSRLGGRRATDPPVRPDAHIIASAPAFPTKALRKFLTILSNREAPVLLDLGPVIGTNVTFFGEALGCKVFIEDLYSDLERHLKSNAPEDLAELLRKRLAHPDASIDGVLAWDFIDYLDQPAAQVLASELIRVMKTDAALLAFFSTTVRADQNYTKYVVVDDQTLRHRPHAASRGRQRVLQNRDIIRLFDGLRVSESFLLQTNLREILFRKPAYLAAPGSV
ncbi:MAG TPA: hypothetical protein VNK41_06425 [Vicinamibacterales bacterium]|nr:hypothetical protein [Vicinamibacterales bacterium]